MLEIDLWQLFNNSLPLLSEPFEKSNTARSVFDRFVFMRVLRVFKVSYEVLEKGRDVDEILQRPF